jgi:hypothetical protein
MKKLEVFVLIAVVSLAAATAAAAGICGYVPNDCTSQQAWCSKIPGQTIILPNATSTASSVCTSRTLSTTDICTNTAGGCPILNTATKLDISIVPVGTTSGTVAAGDDSRITGAVAAATCGMANALLKKDGACSHVVDNGTNVIVGGAATNGKLGVNGLLSIQDGTNSVPSGIVTEVNSRLIEFGTNEGSGNRFGPYVQSDQGGFFRFSAWNAIELAQIYGRAAGVASVNGNLLWKLSITGDETIAGYFSGNSLKLNGSTSGAATIAVPATVTSYTTTIPGAAATAAGQVWASTGANATMQWMTPTTLASNLTTGTVPRAASASTLENSNIVDSGTVVTVGTTSTPSSIVAQGSVSALKCGQLSDSTSQVGCSKGSTNSSANSFVRSNGTTDTYINVPGADGQISLVEQGGYSMMNCTRTNGCTAYGGFRTTDTVIPDTGIPTVGGVSVCLASGTGCPAGGGGTGMVCTGTCTDGSIAKFLSGGLDQATAGADYVAPNSAITGATKTKITYDAKGLVTSGADIVAADVSDGLARPTASPYYCGGAGTALTSSSAGTTQCTSVVGPSRNVSTASGLQGGGDLSADRTISPVYGTTANTVAQGNDSRIVNALPNTTTRVVATYSSSNSLDRSANDGVCTTLASVSVISTATASTFLVQGNITGHHGYAGTYLCGLFLSYASTAITYAKVGPSNSAPFNMSAQKEVTMATGSHTVYLSLCNLWSGGGQTCYSNKASDAWEEATINVIQYGY